MTETEASRTELAALVDDLLHALGHLWRTATHDCRRAREECVRGGEVRDEPRPGEEVDAGGGGGRARARFRAVATPLAAEAVEGASGRRLVLHLYEARASVPRFGRRKGQTLCPGQLGCF